MTFSGASISISSTCENEIKDALTSAGSKPPLSARSTADWITQSVQSRRLVRLVETPIQTVVEAINSIHIVYIEQNGQFCSLNSNLVNFFLTQFRVQRVDLLIMIYDQAGRRKYLTIEERNAFIEAAQRLPSEAAAFCLTLTYTGARISEVLALTPERIDLEAGVVVIESLKKRTRGIYRAIPVPQHLVLRLTAILRVESQLYDARTTRLWPWGRTTGWKLVRHAMYDAGIAPDRAMPKALRHAFGVGATQANVPLNIIQRWMGHARMETTAIYADAVGEEERSLAARMWEK